MELVLMSMLFIFFVTSLAGIAAMTGFILGLIYASSYYDSTEKTGTRQWPSVKRAIAQLIEPIKKHYFGFQIVYQTTELEKKLREQKESIIYAGSPHGLFAISSLFLVGLPSKEDKLWQSITPCIHRHVFSVPFLRDLALWLGAIDVTKENLMEKLKTGSIYLAPGGCREMIIDRTAESEIQSKHRGFLRLAYNEKKLVVPIIHRGQERVFRVYQSDACLFKALDKARHIILDISGYPFPSFFFGPFPASLTSYIYEPHNPDKYDTEEAFVNAYYEKLYQYEKALK